MSGPGARRFISIEVRNAEMTIRGDMAEALKSRFGLDYAHANDIARVVLETADHPDFASRYASQRKPNTDREHEQAMQVYFAVIRFLREKAV
jgi:hypothetical protein